MSTVPGGKPFKVVTELVPGGTRDQHCGGRDIGIENFTLNTNTVKSYVHTLPDSSYRGFLGRHLRQRPVAHLRRRGRARPRLLVRRRPRDPHRAPRRGSGPGAAAS